MFRVLLYGLLLAGCVAAQGKAPHINPAERPPRGPQVWVLTTAHSFHLKEGFGFTLSDLMNQIAAIKPDLVCGEITAQHYRSNIAGGLYPLENVPIEHAAITAGAVFYPADWRIDHHYIGEFHRVTGLMTAE